jgi:hypothetical protein
MNANARLIAWIETHDAAVTADHGDTLVVRSVAVQDGVAFDIFDTIPATLAAARDLLGY